MLIAMGAGAALCILIGVWPRPLYAILPFDVGDYNAYTTTHVITQLQLLFFSALAFTVLKLTAIYPPELPLVNLDFDWFYRKPLSTLVAWTYARGAQICAAVVQFVMEKLGEDLEWLRRHCGPQGILGGTRSTGGMVIWAAILLGAYLVLSYL